MGRNVLYTKDLETMQHLYDANRTVLVDNNIFSFLPQPTNGILVPAFYDNPKDGILPQVMSVVKDLQRERDVRPALHDMFDLTDKIEQTVKKM